VEDEAAPVDVRVLVEVVDALRVERRGAALDAVDLVALGEEQLGQVGAVLIVGWGMGEGEGEGARLGARGSRFGGGRGARRRRFATRVSAQRLARGLTCPVTPEISARFGAAWGGAPLAGAPSAGAAAAAEDMVSGLRLATGNLAPRNCSGRAAA
jgi:hypothetical protein